ncbi:MAG: hypothetical protein JWQ04_764 [Pedosphaera sp.]|nr:hypothetical protein [Pedosphaera sp.]
MVVLSNLWLQPCELPVVPVKITDARCPQLLLSDKPEYFYTGNGIASQEEVKAGKVRLYIYHVPQPANDPLRLSLVDGKTSRPRYVR